mmetsp:Transcript_69958/g.167935  ORF Transcript_69958/g.167935 Transcript_69958/m.167935 type:complete len:342 (+) Transcript_69958:156-1181(+)
MGGQLASLVGVGTGDRTAAIAPLVTEIFAGLESSCLEEKERYERSGQKPSAQKLNFWAAHIGATKRQESVTKSLDFLLTYPEFLAQVASQEQLRFAVLVQHFVSEDTEDFARPASERQHNDTFEGFVTADRVNAQLIKDAHRAEWTLEGESFVLPNSSNEPLAERKQVIANFQKKLVTALENFLLEFCRRRYMSEEGTTHLMQAVTTQMSQCGIANLDRCSRAGRFFVSGRGLEHRINYNLSSVNAGSLGEGLQLTMLCMKTGFSTYQTESDFADAASDSPADAGSELIPIPCSPSSYLYQYATLRFTTIPGVEVPDGRDRVRCDVIDALDDVNIEPMSTS